MKMKYYLRGLGIGIVFCAIITFVAYGNDKKSAISDEEVIRRAEKLGMVMKEETVISTEQTADNTNISTATDVAINKTEKTVESTTEKSEEETTTQETTEETTEMTTEKNTTEEKKNKEDKGKDKKDSSLVKATISVTSGMDSVSVCKLLQDAGIIKDYLDFDNYLNENGYSTQIRIKSCEFTNKMSYSEIAELLVKEE